MTMEPEGVPRSSYEEASSMAESPFVNPDPRRVFYTSDLVLGLWDAFPVSPGHALIVPRRVVATWFDATREEQIALLDGIEAAKQAVERERKPDGYNIGINAGEAAGQTVFHRSARTLANREPCTRFSSPPRRRLGNVAGGV